MKSALLKRRGKGKGKAKATQQPLAPPPPPTPETSLVQATATAAMQTGAILPQQSLSFVQIFLNAAIASVLYTRELLKHDSSVFSERCVADLLGASGPLTYEGLLELNTQPGNAKSQVFKILVKGKSEKADRIIGLLEGGIFHALQSGYLEAIQLSICADSNRPSEVMECYTFTFTYSSSAGQSNRAVSNMTVSPGSQTIFFMGDAQLSFNTVIKQLLKAIHDLPRLPRRRSLGLNLFYTDDCPASYEPQGFTSCTDDDLYFPSGRGLARKSEKTSRFLTGAYRTGVVISHVDSTEHRGSMLVIPEGMGYSTKFSRLDEYKVTSEESTTHNANLPSQSLPMPSQPLASSGIMASPAAPSTQTRVDIQTKEALQEMQRSSSRPQGLLPTQSLVDPDDTDAEDSGAPDQSLETAFQKAEELLDDEKRMIVPKKMAELFVHAKAIQQRCSESDRVFDQTSLDGYRIKRKEESSIVKCECKDGSSWGTMALCEVCGTWQHTACYGWGCLPEASRPDEHVCYSCLLLPQEGALNDWMHVTVACRNVLNYLYVKANSVTVDDMGLLEAARFKGDPKDLMNSEVMQTLLERKLIVGPFVDRITTCNEPRGWSEYVTPVAGISHHYQIQPHGIPPLSVLYKEAVDLLEHKFKLFALDAIRIHDSFGEEVVRYGYYPFEAAIQSRKRTASMVQHSAGSAGEGRSKMPRTARKMSQSKMVCFDQSVSEVQTETESAVESEYGDEDEDDLYN